MSLLEVLVATVILAGSLVVLTELASIGRRRVARIDYWATAQRLCRSKIDEVAAGIQPVANVDDRAFDGDPDWHYSIQTEAAGPAGLTSVKVTVWREEETAGEGGAGRIAGRRPTSQSDDTTGAAASESPPSLSPSPSASPIGPTSSGKAKGAGTGRAASRSASGGAADDRRAGESPPLSFTLVRWVHRSTRDAAGGAGGANGASGADGPSPRGERRQPRGFREGRQP